MQISHDTREALVKDLTLAELERELAARRAKRRTVHSSSSLFKHNKIELHALGHLLHVWSEGSGGRCSLRKEDVSELIGALQTLQPLMGDL